MFPQCILCLYVPFNQSIVTLLLQQPTVYEMINIHVQSDNQQTQSTRLSQQMLFSFRGSETQTLDRWFS